MDAIKKTRRVFLRQSRKKRRQLIFALKKSASRHFYFTWKAHCKLSTGKLQGNSHVRPGLLTKLCLMFLLARKHEYEQNQVLILASKLDFKPGCCMLAKAKSILPAAALQSALILSQYFTMQFPNVSSLVASEETQGDTINLVGPWQLRWSLKINKKWRRNWEINK